MKEASWTLLARGYTPSLAGKSFETENIRVSVIHTAVHITDMTNAGKRGKNVDKFALYDLDYISDPLIQAMVSDFIMDLKGMVYPQAMKRALNLVKRTTDIGPKIEHSKEKGVHVAPPGFKPFKLETPFVSITADWRSFSISDKIDQNNLPACISTSRGGKKSVKLFYRWAQDNANKLKRMTFEQIQKDIRKAGVESHYYCRMD